MDGSINQFPEQAARDNIDKQLHAAGWAVQDKDKIDWNESTGILTRFTDYRDPKPRSRPVFTFHRPETFKAWRKEGKSLRARLLDIDKISRLQSIPSRKQLKHVWSKHLKRF